MRVRAVVAYDGTGYGGFQKQNNAPSIQEELELCLARLTAVSTRVVAAGRTDAGVHASGQVIAFDTSWRHGLADLQRGMNALLPEPIAIRWLALAPAGFHPRYDALRRRYRYTVINSPVRDPLLGRYALFVARPLAPLAMLEATQTLLGTHDFSAFGSPPQGDCAVREVFAVCWEIKGQRLEFVIEANAFLYRMVRILVGTLLRVGAGDLTSADFGAILRERERQRAGPAVAAKGLNLEAVVYPDWVSSDRECVSQALIS